MAAILLVEDDIDVRLLLEHVLASAGCEVNSIETVKSAKRLLDAQPFDLVVADGALPDGLGIEIADHAKAKGVAALIITGAALQLPKERLIEYTYLLKPIGRRNCSTRSAPCCPGKTARQRSFHSRNRADPGASHLGQRAALTEAARLQRAAGLGRHGAHEVALADVEAEAAQDVVGRGGVEIEVRNCKMIEVVLRTEVARLAAHRNGDLLVLLAI